MTVFGGLERDAESELVDIERLCIREVISWQNRYPIASSPVLGDLALFGTGSRACVRADCPGSDPQPNL
jgi:hypothetical protein